MKAKRNQSQQEKRNELVETRRNFLRRPRETKESNKQPDPRGSSTKIASAKNINARKLKERKQDKHKRHEKRQRHRNEIMARDKRHPESSQPAKDFLKAKRNQSLQENGTNS